MEHTHVNVPSKEETVKKNTYTILMIFVTTKEFSLN